MKNQKRHGSFELCVLSLLLLVALLVGCSDGADDKREFITSIDQIDGGNVGYISGSVYVDRIKERFPNSEVFEYNSYSDLIHATRTGRIDAYVTDEPIARSHVKATQGIAVIDEAISSDSYAFMMNKSDVELCAQISEIIERFEVDGTFDALKEKWVNGDGVPLLEFDSSIETPKGELHIGMTSDSAPFSYIVGDDRNIVGYDVEMLYMICEELGYEPVFTDYEYDAMIPAVLSGRARLAIGGITYTEERAESVLFTSPNYHSGTVAVVLDGSDGDGGFLSNLARSFERTLILDNHWQLILRGLLVTLALSVVTLILGTLLGIAYSFMLRSRNRVISGVADVISMVLDGLPLLIILMVMYYVVFAKTTVPAVIIGVIGLTLSFANVVAGMLNTGIDAIDKGQIEAAESMGYSKVMVFRKITFPQATNHMFGSYSGAVLGLVKDTSIVGYITVEDLTKASDLIRNRTFEAFLPLVLTAVIYFLIARVFVMLLARFAKKLDPKHRKREVKGVKLSDND